VLVKRADGARVLIERSASQRDVFCLTFEDDRREEVRNADALMFPSFILGWHEIEQAATDPDVRQAYLDTIANREQIRQLQESADDAMGEIRSLHEQVVNRYKGYVSLRNRVDRLNDLRSGLQELKDANLVELKDAYETAHLQKDSVDALLSWLAAYQGIQLNWESVGLVPEFRMVAGTSPIENFANEASRIADSLRERVTAFSDQHHEVVAKYAVELAENCAGMAAAFAQFATEYDARVSTLSDEQRRLLETHRQVLDQTRELPTLAQSLQEEQDQLQNMLGRLAELCRIVSDALDAQTTHRQERVSELASQLEEYGVRLQVVPRARLTAFEEIGSRNPDGATVFGELTQRFGTVERHHQRLAKGYEIARTDLMDGFPVLLSSVAFAGYVGAFEGDDLRIVFNVGREGEDYREIDQLSAGQRCTAVFPLLLKLQEGPLIVDQPEDNLDNRHIADAIAPALLTDKRGRQITFTSHNANLVVLTDAEHIAMFDSDGSTGEVSARGFLCTRESSITEHVIAVLDGGRSALRLRYQKYGVENIE
jgi:DNA repair exonuclease SbcCD ATPase subunit